MLPALEITLFSLLQTALYDHIWWWWRVALKISATGVPSSVVGYLYWVVIIHGDSEQEHCPAVVDGFQAGDGGIQEPNRAGSCAWDAWLLCPISPAGITHRV